MSDELDNELSNLWRERNTGLTHLQLVNARVTLEIERAIHHLEVDTGNLFSQDVSDTVRFIFDSLPDLDDAKGKSPVNALEIALLVSLRIAKGVQKCVDIGFGKLEKDGENGSVII